MKRLCTYKHSNRDTKLSVILSGNYPADIFLAWYFSSQLIYGVPLSDALQGSFEHAGLADLCIVFGSSLTVTPAADIPQVS